MYLSFDIGGTNIKYGLVDENGAIIEKNKQPTPLEKTEFLSALTEITKSYQATQNLAGIGISAPGVVSKDGVMTTFGALTTMYGLPLRDKLSELTGLPVAVENDGNAAAIAEHWVGAAQNLENYITVVIGTGLGGGLVVNGQVYRGGHGMAGELGWPLYHNLPQAGNIERASENFHSATVLGLLSRYNQVLDSYGPHENFTDTLKLIDLAENGDFDAQQVFQQFVTDLATNLLNLFGIFDPEAILVGGGISENELFMKKLLETWQQLISRHEALNRVQKMGILGSIKRAKLGNDAGMLGAAYTIKQALSK